MKAPFVIIGGGLSGLAAAIRIARYTPDVLILEQHHRLGGLNSYYTRNNHLFETGLHAITNFAPENDKKAPINKLFRQLKLKRKDFIFQQQLQSKIYFHNKAELLFSNDPHLLEDQIATIFPNSLDDFSRLTKSITEHNPFLPSPFISTRKYLERVLKNPLLIDMLLCPLCYYGSSVENDMDFNQFVIMFKSIYLEGMFRPEGTIKDFLMVLKDQYENFGGKISCNSKVKKIHHTSKKVHTIELANGELIECEHVLSTAGYLETLKLLQESQPIENSKRLGFIESIFIIEDNQQHLPTDTTITFFNFNETFKYQSPISPIDSSSGVLCFPGNFQNLPSKKNIELRLTNLANSEYWNSLTNEKTEYKASKNKLSLESFAGIQKIIGNFPHNIVYHDTFTPVTIERFTAKIDGAIYGSPQKHPKGDIGYKNIHLAGTDQGFLGIIGSMLSGVSMANQHILPNI